MVRTQSNQLHADFDARNGDDEEPKQQLDQGVAHENPRKARPCEPLHIDRAEREGPLR